MFNLKYTVQFPEPILRQKLRKIHIERLRNALYFMVERARALAPVDSGKLRDSITVVFGTMDDYGYIWCEVDYAMYVEFGHVSPAGNWVAPNPFLRTARAETLEKYPFLNVTVSTLTAAEVKG